MAPQADLVNAFGVLVVIIIGMLVPRFMPSRAERPAKVTPLGNVGMLGRYATHRGHVAGEVVAITTDRIVLRQSGVHKAVPLSQARLRDGEVMLEGDVDWAAAEDAGKAWAESAPVSAAGDGSEGRA